MENAEVRGLQAEIAQSTSGLTAAEVAKEIAAGNTNKQGKGLTPSVPQILLKNTCTLFNLINLLLAAAIILVGHIEQTLFLGIAFLNTLLRIIQELRAKRALDKLTLLTKSTVQVMRGGTLTSVAQEEVVLWDVLYVSAGQQICADAEVLQSTGLEVNEAFLTGEADNVHKKAGDTLMSGSAVVSGNAYAKVLRVGKQNYINDLTEQAKSMKRKSSPLMRSLTNSIRVLTIVIIPLGAMLFFAQLDNNGGFADTVVRTSAAMIGMIPEGLILLTGITLTLGALHLAQKKALVQTLPAIETLARADVICLDKTGTITSGNMAFEQLVPAKGFLQEDIEAAIAALVDATGDQNATARLLRKTFEKKDGWQAETIIPFSSERKWSAVGFGEQGSYVLGAAQIILKDEGAFRVQIKESAKKGLRVLCLAHAKAPLFDTLPKDLKPCALFILSDELRKNAQETFRFFEQESVSFRIFSGDDPVTVTAVARKAGLKLLGKPVDMSALPDGTDLQELVKSTTIFGRVKPKEKKQLIAALKAAGHTTCMVGDGVNDILAMKEADCSIALAEGSAAARNVCDFVLLDANFGILIDILKQGRRVINNIVNVSSLYLTKTCYSILLTLLYSILPFTYPFSPLQMTPINFFVIGVPSFFLALRANYEKPTDSFTESFRSKALPAAVTVVLNILAVQAIGSIFALTVTEISTLQVIATGFTGFLLIARAAEPLTFKVQAMILALAISFMLFYVYVGRILTISTFLNLPMLLSVPATCVIAYFLFEGITVLTTRLWPMLQKKLTGSKLFIGK